MKILVRSRLVKGLSEARPSSTRFGVLPLLVLISFASLPASNAWADAILRDPHTLRPILTWDGKTLRDPHTLRAKYHWDGQFIRENGTWKRLYVWRKGWLHDSRTHLPLYGIDQKNNIVQARTLRRLFEIREGLVRQSRTLKRVYLVEGSFPLPLLIAYSTGLIR